MKMKQGVPLAYKRHTARRSTPVFSTKLHELKKNKAMKHNYQTKIRTIGILGYALLGMSLMSCSSETPVTITPEEQPLTVQSIPNGGFEEGLENWNVQGDASAVKQIAGGCEGNYALAFESPSSAYETTVSQTLKGLENGLYDLEFYYQNGGGQSACYVAAGADDATRKMTSLRVSSDTWTRSYVRGIKVENGNCQVSINMQADAGENCRIDGLRLISTDKEFNLLKGGDISELTYVEQNGGKYYENGEEKDCVDILKDNGFNIVRLRLYNDPGNPAYSPSNRLPAGIQDETDILRLAKRAKDAGMQIQLTFHYSDYWTNGEDQNKPHEWVNLDFDALKKALYDYTYDFMNKMVEQGTTPEYVSLGNEIQAGMLYPDGSVDSMGQLTELINSGYDAVKAVSPDSKVILHSNAAGNKEQYEWFFGELQDRGAKYDIIGASYYPFWTNMTASEIREWADDIIDRFDKDILIMETGYSWDRYLPDGTSGQLSHNGPYTDFSHLGQKNFMLELADEIKKTKDCRILGFLYWDPIFIEVPGTGWELGDKNYVSNTTLFDFNGNRQEVFDAFKYNN